MYQYGNKKLQIKRFKAWLRKILQVKQNNSYHILLQLVLEFKMTATKSIDMIESQL